MEVMITISEKDILNNFISYKIPNIIKNNSFEYRHDLMECYEEMFNSAHSLLDGYQVRPNEIHCVFEEEFILLLEDLSQCNELKEFCHLSLSTIFIMKKYCFCR